VFAALFNFDGGPLDLQPADGLKVLGAHRQAALLCRTSDAAGEETGIDSLADRYWIAGRIRLDARERLRSQLGPHLADETPHVSDMRLCLHAYAKWGERCVEHLAGDFAFVLWDDTRQRLFTVRDQLGKRVLFHCRTGSLGIIGDSLDWVAQQGAGLRDLDEYWVADFLTLSWSREFHRTVYRDVSRLAPSHRLLWSGTGASVHRYWRLEIAEPLQLERRGAYAERFRELLSLAVADRLPRGKVGIAMSGGLDSTTLAASTVQLTADPRRVVACCEHYEDLMNIEEDRYARLAAQHLDIELQIQRFDDMVYDPLWRERGIRPAEPTQAVLNAHLVRGINQDLSRQAAVWFEGEGPDNALTFDRDPYLSWLLRRRSWRRLAGALVGYTVAKGIRGWAETLRRHAVPAAASDSDAPTLPGWLRPEFVDRSRLVERIRDLGDGGDRTHPWHPTAIASFTCPIWQDYFAGYDLQEALAPVRWRHPFLDLRVLEFMLSVPPVPWGWKKQLIREAMKGRLPDAVVQRPKTPLALNAQAEMIRRHGRPQLSGSALLERYVEPDLLPPADASPSALMQSLSAHVLDHWMSLSPIATRPPSLYRAVPCG